jgi:signal transduction histidine kinase
MAMPTGDDPQTVEQYYNYLQAHHQTDHTVATWHVDWFSLAWLWGFVIVLSLGILFWVWQYRTTLQRHEGRAAMYPVDNFGGYTTEQAGPATLFFILLTVVITGFAAALIIGHLVWGQKF